LAKKRQEKADIKEQDKKKAKEPQSLSPPEVDESE